MGDVVGAGVGGGGEPPGEPEEPPDEEPPEPEPVDVEVDPEPAPPGALFDLDPPALEGRVDFFGLPAVGLLDGVLTGAWTPAGVVVGLGLCSPLLLPAGRIRWW
jgi:hypothetical protein